MVDKKHLLFPSRHSLLSLFRIGRLDDDFFLNPLRYELIREFSGLTAPDGELSKIELMWEKLNSRNPEILKPANSSARFTYDDINNFLTGFASIEPDIEGGYMLVFQERLHRTDLYPDEGTDLTNMTAAQLASFAEIISGKIIVYLYQEMRPGLEKYLRETGEVETYAEAAEKKKYPPLSMLRGHVKAGTLIPTLFDPEKTYNIIRDFSGLDFTREQFDRLQVMWPRMVEKKRQTPKARVSFQELNSFMEGIAQLQKNEDGGYSLLFAQTHEPAESLLTKDDLQSLDLENMSTEQAANVARTTYDAVLKFFYEKMKDELSEYGAQIEGIEKIKALQDQEVAGALAQIRQAKREDIIKRVLGNEAIHQSVSGGQELASIKHSKFRILYTKYTDPDKFVSDLEKIYPTFQENLAAYEAALKEVKFDDKTGSGRMEVVSKTHPEFRISYTAKSPEEFYGKIKDIFPAFKKKLDAYDTLIIESYLKYGLEWEVQSDTIVATSADFDIQSELASLKLDKKKPLKQCTGDDLISWKRRVVSRIEDLNQKRLAEYYGLDKEGFEVEPYIDGKTEKICIRRKHQSKELTAPVVGTKRLIGREALAAIRNAEKELPVKSDKKKDDETEKSPANELVTSKKTELLMDNVTLSILANPRAKDDSWLHFVTMAKSIPEVGRVMIPSVIADFESRACIPEYGESGQFELASLYNGSAGPGNIAKAKVQLFEKATRIRIRQDGSEEIIKAGDSKLVIFDSPMQEAFYEKIRGEKMKAEAAGLDFRDELPNIREGFAKNMGENALYDYCQHYSQAKPVIVTDDYNSFHQRNFMAKIGDSEDKLTTKEGVGIGFATTRGFVNAVCESFANMSAPLFGKIVSDKAVTDVSPNAVEISLRKNPNAKKDLTLFTSEFPPYIAGRGTKHPELQLHNRLSGSGLSWLRSMNMGTPTLLGTNWKSAREGLGM